ncbi:Lrp/AsnC ligand binding domain-containing protein [Streptomyces sp. NPDC059991]|uniref:Lrp/AsnC ligand binding domain-containing protein n=1 Tax=Streptomyces sp. NPDC059991 TaxID=3347028 RepID=UPI00368432B4
MAWCRSGCDSHDTVPPDVATQWPISSSAQPPDHLATAGQALADHHAVHGAFATSGPCNLHAAAYFPDLTALYEFLSRDLTGLGTTHVESAIVSRTAERLAPPAPNR